MNAYKGGPRTQIFKGEEGGGASFSRGYGVPTAHSFRNPLSHDFPGWGGGPMAPFLHTQRWSGLER